MGRKISIIKNSNFYAFGVLGLIVLRAVSNWIIPLMDKTEARYAEIARIMVDSNNWVTPQIDYGVPFWAKPPLSTWLSAISMKIFGINEFAVRLPSLILSIVIVILVGQFAKQKKLPFFLPGFILLTIPEFLLHAGVVSTDVSLAFCVTIMMLSFWITMNQEKPSYWRYLFFVAMGFGFLAKGPIVLILTMPPIILWVLLFNEYRSGIKKFPWILGALIALAIAVPWYYLAELRTKGFLDYFIVGEHFKRFFDSSWKGDKYGFPKTQPFGIIWVFLFIFSLPWIQLVFFKLWKFRANLSKDKWLVFLLFWLLWTPFFFTFSKSLIHTYILPVMVPVALLVVHFWDSDSIKRQRMMVITSLIVPFLVIVTLLIGLVNNNLEQYSNTDKFLLKGQVQNSDVNLYYFGKKSYSSQFYSHGKIKSVSFDELSGKLKTDHPFEIIIPDKFLTKVKESDLKKLRVVKSNAKKHLYIYEEGND
ncbi:glycosyltransferase family 39 protein [Prolixibacter sp. SD074]|uniref:ArnT family glycosyltransferase n=1 Tax=Prolixibacter sp. SD074 TaxID=2652391 RepID=UPI00127A4368|nr:glycosyltransferase family 39 protein [Prolixibacter sp. SD074]GET28239.1 phospholipid carrier-dependent glycosyltransferase [Prolixibacter sp. SD074]